jgi:carboxyl-terminal processing protease
MTLAIGIYIGQNFIINLQGAPSLTKRTLAAEIKNKAVPGSVNLDFDLFWKVWSRVTADYLDKSKADPQKLYYGAIKGVVEALGDPYTVFLDPTQNKDFNTQLSGSFEGVGMQLGVKDGKLVVIAPIDGSPAAVAGVQAGDFIAKIGTKDATGLSLYDAVSLIRGSTGSEVKITFLRDGVKNPIEKTLKRATIKVNSVTLTKKGTTALIKISQFGDTTDSEWDKTADKVLSDGFKGVVLDMRNNPGGRLESAVHIISTFVDAKKIAVQQEDQSGNKRPLFTLEDGRFKDLPVVVLINGGSASASEIVAGALRDLRGVQLTGEKSFGKGTVQEVQPFDDGSGLHLTTSKWLTPKDTWVHEKGLEPDVKIPTNKDDPTKDPQLDKALQLVPGS